MTSEEEIRLFGYPISIRVPGNKDEKYVPRNRYNNQPILSAGQKLDGYCLSVEDFSTYDTYFIDENNKLQKLNDYPQIYWDNNITKKQPFITYERTHKMLLWLYNKIRDLEEK